MATTFLEFTGDGNATKAFSFPSIQASDIKVTVDGVLQTSGTHYNLSGYTTTGGGDVVFIDTSSSGGTNHIPQNPALIRIFRDTNLESPAATYTAGASVKAKDLNANHEQLLFHAQEEQNQLEQTADIRNDAIVTSKILDDNVTMAKLGSGALPTDITVASANIVDGTIVNADVNTSAAIDGTKISPNFGSQNITTTGTVNGVTTTELSILDGATVTTNELNILDGVTANKDELNLLDGVTATTTELNKLDGVTASTSEINILDGATITTAQLNNLQNIEAAAKDDQTGAEIKSLYEAESNTNAFTDAEKTKLGNLGSLNALSDVNTAGAADGKILKYDASASEFIIADDGGSGSGGASAFTGLSDTPANFGNAAGKTVKVNSAGDALEFVTVTTPTQDIVDDQSPQLGGNLDVQDKELNTSTTNGNIKLNPNGTGVVEVKGAGGNDGTLQLNCSANSHGVKIKSPPHSASASYTLTLPPDDGDADEVLKTDGNGGLDWTTIATDSITEGNSKAEIIDGGTGQFKVAIDGTDSTLTVDASSTVFGRSGANQAVQIYGSLRFLLGSGVQPIIRLTNLGNIEVTGAYNGGSSIGQVWEFGGYQGTHISGGNIKPLTDSTFDLGTNTVRWQNIYADNLHGDGSNLTNLPVSPYNIQINTISSYSGTGGNSATFNNTAYRFVLSNPGANAQAHLVSINGVVQKPNSGTSQPSEGFAIDGTSIIFSSPPPSGADFFILTLGTALNIGTPGQGTVNNDKIVDDTISEAKLDIHAAPSGTDKVLGYTANGMEWVTAAAGATGGGTNKIFYENETTVDTSYTIAGNANTAMNAMSAGPITISGSSTVVTIGTNQNWTIV